MGDHYTILTGSLEGPGGGGSSRSFEAQFQHHDEDMQVTRSRCFGSSMTDEVGVRRNRISVFREVACVGWQLRSPRYWEVPPSLESLLQPDVGLFLAGGLYVSVLKARAGLFPLYQPAYVVVFLFMVVLFLVLSWGTPLLFEEATGDSGESRFKYISFYGCLIGIYLFSCVPSFIITRPAVARFHDDMEAAVQELAPVFRRFGRNVEYRRHGCPSGGAAASGAARCVSCCDREAVVAITPFDGEVTPDEASRAGALWDSRPREPGSGSEAIKVTVYHEATIFGRECRQDDLSFFSVRSYDSVHHLVDPFAWGRWRCRCGRTRTPPDPSGSRSRESPSC